MAETIEPASFAEHFRQLELLAPCGGPILILPLLELPKDRLSMGELLFQRWINVEQDQEQAWSL